MNSTTQGLAGDPYHEGSSQPQAHLQGGMAGIHTQTPMTSEAQTNPRSAGADNVGQSWESTSFAPKPASTHGNSNPVH